MTKPKPVLRPTAVKVGHCTYEIKWLNEQEWLHDLDDSKAGLFLADSMAMYLRLENNGRPTHEDQLRETLLHEILHACWFHANMGGHGAVQADELEEWVVGCLSFPLIAVLRENPDVMKYLEKP